MTEISQNPFTVHSPDALEEVPPKRIVDLFVEEHTDLPKVKQRKHTFLWGSRGSGKSFIMRYLTPECQYLTHDSAAEFLQSEDSFISVFSPCKENQRDKSELNLLDDPAARTISEHLLNISVAQDVISTISNQVPNEFIPEDEAVQFAKRVANLFDNASIAPSESEANDIADVEQEPFFWLEELFSAEDRRVNHYLRNLHFEENTNYTAATSGYHDFLLPLLEAAQKMMSLENTPFYILLDDAFRLSERQQKVINTWVANRDQGTVCIKISSDPFRYDTYETVTGARIERTHDYVEVDLDELYTSDQNEYFKKVERIANKRLKLSGLPVDDIEEFLPKSEFEKDLYEELKEKTEQEWKEGERTQSKDDYVSRYTQARLFQELADRKNKKSYAGFENIVHMSSGIVRYFLEPCSLMFSEYVTQDMMNPSEVEQIPPDVQDRVLKRYSKQLLRDLPEKLETDISEEEMTKLDKLRRLVDSLGQLFYQRLHDPESKEPRLFSFTVRGQIETGSELDDILKLGRQLQLFQVRTYSSKEGGGREDWYILNRRLAPMYKLDPSVFQGRIRLTPDDLRLAYRNEARFVDKVLDVDIDQQSLTNFGDLDE